MDAKIGELEYPQFSRPYSRASQSLALSNKWKECWSLDASVGVVSRDPEPAEEEELWTKYWELDRAGTEKFSESEERVQQMLDQQVWNRFKETVEIREDGYYVRLPWKESCLSLPDNRAIAYRRLVSTWASLKEKGLLDQYNEVFQEQLRQNIIEVVNEEERVLGRVHYIPHQAVLTPHKSTTKLRTVFDASAHYRNACSLNDNLHRGPVILPSLHGLLLRFRFGRIAMIADVEKAFLQVHLQEIDRDATRFLWLRNHNESPCQENIQTYRFTRVTFGLLSSPFLLAATICFHLDQSQGNEELVGAIKKNLYVDNLLLSSDTLEEAVEQYSRTKEIFNELHMNLREYVSNNRDLMATIADKDRSFDISPKVLGILWDSEADILHVTCKIPILAETTKRTVASAIASIYDPMGWMLPLVHKAKIFLQSLWKTTRDWDTPLTEEECEQWKRICDGINGFHKPVPRFLTPKRRRVTLVSFADASNEAMASCVYLRVEDWTHLLMAKAKLPSINSKITIPKLELNAMTLAMRLTYWIITQLQSVVIIDRVVVLSDSEIALNWIKSRVRHDAGPFIKNRVNEIQQIASKIKSSGCPIQFGHISSQSNPADCATRGLDKYDLVNHFWWTGPDFIRVPLANWNELFKAIIIETTFDDVRDESIPSTSSLIVGTTIKASELDPKFFQSMRVQTLPNVKRTVAHIMRFIRVLVKRVRNKRNATAQPFLKLSSLFEISEDNQMSTNLSGEEIALAGKMLVRQHQLTSLTPEVLRSLHHLNLHKDEFGIWRCLGRLGNSALGDDAKFPMFVLQKSWLSKLLINDYHSKGHPTTNHTMALIRQHYWIPKLRSQVTVAIRRCIECQRFNNLPFKYPEQSDLPSRRVLRSRPFNHVGLDYFGPLTIRKEDGSMGKCYGCIITCLTTRLIHLDVASDLSTYAFIQMLRRFFARRGFPSTITGDNAPTFTLGDSVLQECIRNVQNDSTIAKLISNNEIRWKYITPFAPWQGGVYERLIRSVKLALYKFQGRSVPTHEELITVLTEIEAMLNTRPLVYTESGPRENSILRPIDFLQNNFEIPLLLNSSSEISEDSTYISAEERATLQSKIQVMEALKSSCEMPERFWQIWQTEYLTSLRERHQREVGKQRGSSYVPKIGQVVLICDALQPRHCWKMGRIETLVSNSNGIVREAVVLLPSHRRIRRPVNLLVPLEIDDELQDEVREEESRDDAKTSEENSRIKDNHTGEIGSRYNFRSKQRVNYSENFVSIARVIPHHFTVVLMLSIFTMILSAAVAQTVEPTRHFVHELVLPPSDNPFVTVGETRSKLSNPRVVKGIRVLSHVRCLKESKWKYGNHHIIRTAGTYYTKKGRSHLNISIRVNERIIDRFSLVSQLCIRSQYLEASSQKMSYGAPGEYCSLWNLADQFQRVHFRPYARRVFKRCMCTGEKEADRTKRTSSNAVSKVGDKTSDITSTVQRVKCTAPSVAVNLIQSLVFPCWSLRVWVATPQIVPVEEQSIRVFSECSLKLQKLWHATPAKNIPKFSSFYKKITRIVGNYENSKFISNSKVLFETSQKFMICILSHFRLASKEEDGDIRLLIDLTRARVHDQQQIRAEIDMAAISLQRQKKIATTLVAQWNHHKNEESFIGAPAAEQMRLTTQLLRQAEVTKERILRMGTRYLIMDSWHEYMTEWGDVSGFQRQDWLELKRDYAFGPRAIVELIQNQCDILNIEIEDMKAMLLRQEKELTEPDRLTSFQMQRILKREIESLQEHLSRRSDVDELTKKVESQTLEIASIKSNMRTVEVVTASTPVVDCGGDNQDMEPDLHEVEEDHENVDLDEEDDDEGHWKRMVSEVTDAKRSGGNWYEDEEPAPKTRRVEYSEPIIAGRIRVLRENLRRMESDFARFPYRDRHDQSQGIPRDRDCAFCGAVGIHYSDACPQFRNGKTRYEIILQKKWCLHCLEGPEKHKCRYRLRKCWYCLRLKGTVFEDLCPEDKGFHHRAVCNVPDLKYVARSRVEDTQRELWQMMSEPEPRGGGRHAEPGVTTTSKRSGWTRE